MATIDDRTEFNIPPPIKAAITRYRNAVDDAAFAGSYEIHHAIEVENHMIDMRYNLEATIQTYLAKPEKN